MKRNINGEIFFETENIKIINEDFLRTEMIQKALIDLIVTSPPYNIDIRYNEFDDSIEYDNYLNFSEKWLSKSYDLLKDDGRLCLNIPLHKNKGGHQSVYADLVHISKKVGFKYHSTIIWNEQNISRRTA